MDGGDEGRACRETRADDAGGGAGADGERDAADEAQRPGGVGGDPLGVGVLEPTGDVGGAVVLELFQRGGLWTAEQRSLRAAARAGAGGGDVILEAGRRQVLARIGGPLVVRRLGEGGGGQALGPDEG